MTPMRRQLSSSSLSAFMTEDTLGPLESLFDRPGLAFYIAYAHVKDVSAHLTSIRNRSSSERGVGGGDNYGLATLTACILSSQEMLLGLLYRSDVTDFRLGVDKFALGLAVADILLSFASVLNTAAALDEEDRADGGDKDGERIISQGESPDVETKSTSFFYKLEKAESLGLLSSGTKSALSSALEVLKEDSPVNKHVALDPKTRNALERLNGALGSDNTFAPAKTCAENYGQTVLKVPSLVLKSHENADGGVQPSPHGPEDYIFQITHVILEHFFWYIENILSAPSGVANNNGSSALIIMQHIFDSCTKVLGILEFMLLTDFHPLRVAVHGSSGFYSMAWHRIRSWFTRTFKETSVMMNLDQVHTCPEMFAKETLYVQRLDRVSAAWRTMCFRHYVLAERTIGSNSMGSAGKSFEQMQGTFQNHPSGEHNAAKYRMHEYTNVKYASFVGLGTQAIMDGAKAAVGHDDDMLDNIGYEEHCEQSNSKQISKYLLLEIERCFVESDTEAFMELFDTSNCRIEHPPGTLAYLGVKVKSYILNFTKRHPFIHSFHCISEKAGNITINVDADLFQGTRVQYQIKGNCILDGNGLILRLLVSGLPDISAALYESNDQRSYVWAVSEPQLRSDCHSLQQGYRRPLAPPEILAYEMNSNSGKEVSDGLTIVARSIVQGECAPRELVQDAIDQVAKRHMLLNASVEVTEHGHYFVVAESNSPTSVEIIEAGTRLDCEKYLNTKFDCENGEMIRVIVSKLETSFELVTVIFHGICDAISVRDLHCQIIRQLATVVSNADIPDCMFVLNETSLRTSIPLPAIHLAKRVLSERTSPAAEPLPPPKPVPISVPKIELSVKEAPRSMAFTVKLSKEETGALLSVCKNRGTTVHAAIGAAALLSADCGESRMRVLTSAVDLRRRLQMRTDELVYSVGGFDGSAGFEYNLDVFGEFWDLCHAIKSDLVDTIDSGRLLTTYSSCIEGLVGAYKAGYLVGGCFGTVFLSNIGNEAYEKQFGDLRWMEFDYIYGQFLPGGPHYHITCSTFDKKMTLNFQYVQPTIPTSVAEAFANATVKVLLKNINYIQE